MQTTIPTLEQAKALDGRIFAMLTAREVEVLDFYRTQGRKFDVSVSIVNKADPAELARAKSQAQTDEILKKANSLVTVEIGSGAEAAWLARSVH